MTILNKKVKELALSLIKIVVYFIVFFIKGDFVFSFLDKYITNVNLKDKISDTIFGIGILLLYSAMISFKEKIQLLFAKPIIVEVNLKRHGNPNSKTMDIVEELNEIHRQIDMEISFKCRSSFFKKLKLRAMKNFNVSIAINSSLDSDDQEPEIFVYSPNSNGQNIDFYMNGFKYNINSKITECILRGSERRKELDFIVNFNRDSEICNGESLDLIPQLLITKKVDNHSNRMILGFQKLLIYRALIGLKVEKFKINYMYNDNN